MRLISQDMKNDIPYEQTCLYANKCEGAYQIEAFVPNNENFIIMGKYKNFKETLEVMEELHYNYYHGSRTYPFPEPKEEG